MSLPSTARWPSDDAGVPHVDGSESFGDLVDKLSQQVLPTVCHPVSDIAPGTLNTIYGYPTASKTSAGASKGAPCNRSWHTSPPRCTIRPSSQPSCRFDSTLAGHYAWPRLLGNDEEEALTGCRALKGHFSALEEASDEPGVNEARGYACEHVAWQFLSSLADRDVIDFLLLELPAAPCPGSDDDAEDGLRSRDQNGADHASEQTPLLEDATRDYFGSGNQMAANARFSSLTSQCENLSALEIAAVSGAKKFLSQRPIQKIINGLWRGDIVFWETLSVNSVKKPRKYNRNHADLFCRLRVPLYLKVLETLFFAVFLALYYAVLVHRDFHRVTISEILLYVWIASFAYDEFADWVDAGQTSFYASDFWWTWDISIVVVGVIFCVLRIVGLSSSNKDTIDLAYDVLGLEALFLVPRIFSLLSLNRYFGTLVSHQVIVCYELHICPGVELA
jgi:hypothetical protein